jgi:hypothetical protein
MCRFVRFLLIGILVTALPSAMLAQVNPFQGVYDGKLLIRAASRGFQPYFFPSRMTVLPDGHSILLTTQLPNSVSTVAIRGSFNGNLFEGLARGRFNPPNYNQACAYKIRFIRNEARINANSIHKSPGYVHDPREDETLIFYRVRS